jgi:peptidoglycan/xylan/chitin deacetylase (PgdA/CDA1 family)
MWGIVARLTRTSPRRAGVAVAGLVALFLLAVWDAPAAPAEEPGRTLVSFTFDGSSADQKQALDLLQQHGMGATIYVNSSRVGAPGALSFLSLKSYSQHGMEVGGHPMHRVDLTTASGDRARREICGGRVALTHMGFGAESFAYPRGAVTPAIRSLVEDCGYRSARTGGGLGPSDSERVPPSDPFHLRAYEPLPTTGAATVLEEHLLRVQEAGGGWVPVALRHICDTATCEAGSMRLAEFTALVGWLDGRSHGIEVSTVASAMTPSAEKRPVPTGAVAVTLLGLGIGQSQIMGAGLLVGLLSVVSYRFATRRGRYVRAE